MIEVDSGYRFAALARTTARAGLAGLEWAAGIPGAIGGGLPTNAGAYGSDLSDVLVSIRTVSPEGESCYFEADELGLEYRDSRLRSGSLAGHIITTVTLQLQHGDVFASLAEIDRVESLRKQHAPTGPSLGSTFKNPTGDTRSAGQLIEAAGLKGVRIGAAQVSDLACQLHPQRRRRPRTRGRFLGTDYASPGAGGRSLRPQTRTRDRHHR